MSTETTTAAASSPTTTVTEKRKPVFVKVDSLNPGTYGHTLTVKVVSAKPVTQKAGGRPTPVAQNRPRARIAECLVGDETGSIIFTARNDQDWGPQAARKKNTLLGCYLYPTPGVCGREAIGGIKVDQSKTNVELKWVDIKSKIVNIICGNQSQPKLYTNVAA